MRAYIEEAVDQIDSAMFSGDAFLDLDHRKALREYMAAWERQMQSYEQEEENMDIGTPVYWLNGHAVHLCTIVEKREHTFGIKIDPVQDNDVVITAQPEDLVPRTKEGRQQASQIMTARAVVAKDFANRLANDEL